jgi:hypothetical protein
MVGMGMGMGVRCLVFGGWSFETMGGEPLVYYRVSFVNYLASELCVFKSDRFSRWKTGLIQINAWIGNGQRDRSLFTCQSISTTTATFTINSTPLHLNPHSHVHRHSQ